VPIGRSPGNGFLSVLALHGGIRLQNLYVERQPPLFHVITGLEPLEYFTQPVGRSRGEKPETSEVAPEDRHILRARDPRTTKERPVAAQSEEDVQSIQIVPQWLSLEHGRAAVVDYGRDLIRQTEFESEFVCTCIEHSESVRKRFVSRMPVYPDSHVSGSC
jgi:hypothetical protein